MVLKTVKLDTGLGLKAKFGGLGSKGFGLGLGLEEQGIGLV